MNARSSQIKALLSLTLSLTVWGGDRSLAIARSSRYPTDSELQGLMEEFRFQAGRSPRTKRSAEQNQALREFKETWSQLAPTVAPFLGDWTGWTNQVAIAIYPSQVSDRVCIIDYTLDPVLSIGFSVGYIANNRVETLGELGRSTIIKDREALGLAKFESGQPSVFTYSDRRHLEKISDFLNPAKSFVRDPAEAERIIREFHAAGCLDSSTP